MTTVTEPKTEAQTGTNGWEGQTFLVGEHIYLRTFMPGDEKNAMSWRSSVFPKSPEAIEKWIKEGVPSDGAKNKGHLAIVRKSDDTVVGNISTSVGRVGVSLYPYVDVLYGETGQEWLAEAIRLVARWQVDENFVPRADVHLSANNQVAVDSLLSDGFVQSARFREMLEVNGQRVDKLLLVYLSDAWVERIGHPMETAAPSSGNDDVRPVPAKVSPDGDPPKQAVMIGERVYLRPQDKKDARHYVDGKRLETETFYDVGRDLTSLAEWESFVSSNADKDFPSTLWFEVCLRENDEPIGSVGLMDIDYVNRTAETGSHFYKPEYRGKGYGSEAKHLLFEYTFDVLGLHTVISFVLFPNTRSAAALRKQGYTEIGRVCWNYLFEGGFGNMLAFDLLADEWRALPRAQQNS